MKSKDQFIESMRLKCEELIGRQVKKNNDVKELETILNKNIDRSISLSSLRRFFYLIPSTKPNDKTLNIIAEGLGYSSFVEFCKSTNNYNDWSYLNKLIQHENKDYLTKDEILYLEKTSYQHCKIFAYFLRKLIENEKNTLLDQIFSHPNIFLRMAESDKGELAQIIGESTRKLKLKQVKNLGVIMINNELLRNFLLYMFVDYNGFFGNYFYLLKYVNENSRLSYQETLFYQLICRSRNLLQNKNTENLDDLIKPVHPILLGRYIGHKIINYDDFSLNDINIKKKDVQSFAHELIPLLIINKEFKDLDSLIGHYYEDLISPGYNTFEDKQAIALIALSISNINKHNYKEAAINLNFINLEEILPSHRDFLSILFYIPKYFISVRFENEDKNKEILTQFITLVKTLEFSLFSMDYLKNYFKK